jgi:hypothetical protein
LFPVSAADAVLNINTRHAKNSSATSADYFIRTVAATVRLFYLFSIPGEHRDARDLS